MLEVRVAILLILVTLILSSCAQTNQSKKLLSNIETHLDRNYNIEYGDVVVKYDLAGLGNSKCLHAKDYGKIINDPSHNSKFINKASSRCKRDKIEQRAVLKLTKLKKSLLALHNKYGIFSGSEVRDLELERDITTASVFDNIDNAPQEYLRELHKIDHRTRDVPLFFPQHSATLTSSFGMRKHPINGCTKLHAGTDFAGDKMSPIYASACGRVTIVEKSKKGYGYNIVITHSKRFKTRYAHLARIFVKLGDEVIRGQKIALQGSTGKATAEHLHFEILHKDKHVNPIDFVMDGYSCSAR